jgi:hypothetical protein
LIVTISVDELAIKAMAISGESRVLLAEKLVESLNHESISKIWLAEFKDAAIYYYEKSPSLASVFYTEVENVIEKIVDKPDLYPITL